MVTTEHEQMHGSLMGFTKMEMTWLLEYRIAKRTQLQFFSNNVELSRENKLHILEEIDMLIRIQIVPFA